MNYNKNIEILQDIKIQKNTGKVKLINWKNYKKQSLYLSDIYYELYGNLNTKAQRCKNCGSELIFKKYSDGELKLHSANFCKIRLCPMCSWRRSLKIYGQVSKIVDELEKSKEYEYLFLTLTLKNCKSYDLTKNIDLMFKSFNLLTKRKQFKNSIKGFFRNLEVTYNIKNNEYHPHFHVLIVVNKTYFNDVKYYLSQKNWTNLWKSCLNIDYNPIVDIRKVKKINSKTVAEISKYAVKSSDYLIKDKFKNIDKELSMNVVETLDKSLTNRRLTTFGGILKDIHKKLNLDDQENGNLVNIKKEEDIRTDLYELVKYIYSSKYTNYLQDYVIY